MTFLTTNFKIKSLQGIKSSKFEQFTNLLRSYPFKVTKLPLTDYELLKGTYFKYEVYSRLDEIDTNTLEFNLFVEKAENICTECQERHFCNRCLCCDNCSIKQAINEIAHNDYPEEFDDYIVEPLRW